MSEWKEKTLGELSIRVSSGLTPLKSNKKFWENPSIPWLKTDQLGEKYIFDTNTKISKEALEQTSLRIYPENTISIAMYGEGKTRGNISIIKAPMTTNQACCNIEIDPKLADVEYVYYYLKTQYDSLRKLSSGVRKNLNSNDIKNYKIYIPESVSVQKSIIRILTSLDNKITLNNQINQELEAMAKTLYDYWYVQFDFPDQNGKPYKSSGGKMVYHPELKREIPEGWGVEKLDDLGTIVGGSTPTKSISDNFTKGGEGYSWITPNDLSNNKGNKFIKNGEIDVTVRGLKDASLKLYPEGTVLMSSRAPVGYLAIATKELTINQGFKSFIPDKKYEKNYIYYTLQNCLKVIEQNASGSTFKEISATVLKDITIIQPNLDIVKKFEEKVSSINSYIKVNEEQNQELTQLRDWLLPMLMNGQVKVE
jgi:hypothetical protein